MPTPEIPIRKQPLVLTPDNSRVILRFIDMTDDRAASLIERVAALTEAEVERVYAHVLEEYAGRHRYLDDVFRRHYEVVCDRTGMCGGLSDTHRMLIGSFFTMEYAVESAALFNPSIVPHPDQNGVPAGCLRAIMSLRAVGEGHVSSIEFREVMIEADYTVTLEPVQRFVAKARIREDRRYEKNLFAHKLLDMSPSTEMSALDAAVQTAGLEVIRGVMDRLGRWFTHAELRDAMNAYCEESACDPTVRDEVYHRMSWLARSNYEIVFPEDSAVSERVIFPLSSTESRGIEDARFVRFVDDDGNPTYYATYTAFDGAHILTQFIETDDFRRFRIHTLNGTYAQSKGMALFPRTIGGRYAMVSRVDGESLYIMYSDNIHFWNDATRLQRPEHPWELLQIGTCGSPIETEAGWLVITHGVGPMRTYSISATLLDLEDPSRVIGQLPYPLLRPEAEDREGYVPNVVYSCGALVHNGELIIPYAVSDYATRVAAVPLASLLTALKSHGAPPLPRAQASNTR